MRSSSSGRLAASTATGRPTSPWPRRRRPAATRRELAPQLAERLTHAPPPHVERVEIAGPGFVNFRLRDSWLHDVLARRRRRRRRRLRPARHRRTATRVHGRVRVGQPDRAAPRRPRLVRRPTATRSRGCSSAAATRSPASSTSTTRGGQMRRFGASVAGPQAAGEPVPEDGYHGAVHHRLGARYDGPDDVEAGRWGGEQRASTTSAPDARARSTSTSTSGSARRRSRTSGAVGETLDALRGKGRGLRRRRRDVAAHRPTSATTRTASLVKSDGEFTYLLPTSPTTATSSDPRLRPC